MNAWRLTISSQDSLASIAWRMATSSRLPVSSLRYRAMNGTVAPSSASFKTAWAEAMAICGQREANHLGNVIG